eukprot:56362-Eustigmatos_ZCMA.PRE.1
MNNRQGVRSSPVVSAEVLHADDGVPCVVGHGPAVQIKVCSKKVIVVNDELHIEAVGGSFQGPSRVFRVDLETHSIIATFPTTEGRSDTDLT